MKINGKIIALTTLIFLITLLNALVGGAKPKQGEGDLEQAIIALREAPADKKADARTALLNLARQYPDSESADNALLESAKSLLADEKYEEAVPLIGEVIEKYPDSDSAPEAKYLLGFAYYRMKRMEDAATALANVAPKNPRYADASILYIRVMLDLGKNQEAVKRYSELIKLDPKRASEVDENVAKALENLKSAELTTILDKIAGSALTANVLYTLGERAFKRGDYATARELFTKLLAQQPKFQKAEKARAMLKDMESAGAVDARTIGVLLPLTGKYAPYGRKILEAMAIAISAFNPSADQGAPVRFEIMDVSDDPAQAAEAARRLIVEKRVIAIAGPLSGDAAKAAAQVAQDYGTPIIAMSLAEDVTNIGPMVFRNWATPRDQVQTLVWYAATNLGVRNFAALYPDNAYARMLTDLFAQEVRKQGGTMTLSIAYKPGQADFRNEIGEISKRKRDIDGIFIPDNYMAAATIAPQLIYYNVARIRILGSSGWNSPKLIEMTRGQTSSVENAVFTDAFFVDSVNPIAQTFVADFEQTYGRKPDIYEALGYETARILVELVKKGSFKDRLAMRDALANLKNFPTFSGNISVKPDRSFYRPLFLLQVRDGKITEVIPQGQM